MDEQFVTEKTPPDQWPSKFFRPDELRCKGTGRLLIPLHSLLALEKARLAFDHPMHIVSGFRTKKHNAMVGGAPNSFHLRGLAYDISTVGLDAGSVMFLWECLRDAGFAGLGVYPHFIHADLGPSRLWHG